MSGQSPLQRLPLHLQIANRLRNHIQQDLKPGDQLETEKALARQLDVGVSTIREAITTFAHEGLVERRAGRGTFVLARPTPTPHVAVYARVDVDCGPANTLSSLLSARVMSLLVHKGVRAKMYWLWRKEGATRREPGHEDLTRDLAEDRINVFIHVQGMIDAPVLEQVRDRGIPLVSMRPWPPTPTWTVAEDTATMIQHAVGHLADHGCRRIASLEWVAEGPSRYRPLFRRQLAARGLVFHPEWAGGEFHPNAAGAGYAEFREIWTAAAEKPDGLLVMDDVLLPEVVAAITELKIAVPGRLRVVARATQGAMSSPHFPAARFETDLAAQAEAMAELSARLVRGESPARRHVTVPWRWWETPGGTAVVFGKATEQPDGPTPVTTNKG